MLKITGKVVFLTVKEGSYCEAQLYCYEDKELLPDPLGYCVTLVSRFKLIEYRFTGRHWLDKNWLYSEFPIFPPFGIVKLMLLRS